MQKEKMVAHPSPRCIAINLRQNMDVIGLGCSLTMPCMWMTPSFPQFV